MLVRDLVQDLVQPLEREQWGKGGPSFPASLALLWPIRPSLVGAQKCAVGPAPEWSYTGAQYDADGVSVGAVPAWHTGKGVWCGPAYTNLFAGGPSIARSVSLTAQKYTLTCDAGSVACSYGTATPSTPLTFTATAGSTTFTPTGVTKWQLTASVAPMPYVAPGVTVPSAAGTSGGNGVAWAMSAKMTAALSGKCTVAALVTMGVGSADLATGQIINGLSWRNNDSDLRAAYDAGGNKRIVGANDGATTALLAGTWNTGERHLKVVQVNAAGTQFRVGNRKLGAESTVTFGSWATFDGSFNPLTHLRAGLGAIVPLHLLGVQIWNAPEVSEADIEKQFKAVGVM